MKYRPLPESVFNKHYAYHTAEEVKNLSARDFQVLQFIRTYAGAFDKFGPIADADISKYLKKISLHSFQRGRDALNEMGRIVVTRRWRGMVYELPDRKADAAILRKVRSAELQLGHDAPDCIVQMAMAPIKPAIKRARYKLAKEREAS